LGKNKHQGTKLTATRISVCDLFPNKIFCFLHCCGQVALNDENFFALPMARGFPDNPAHSMRRTAPLILGLFFCSGATALVYEVVWSKYLGLMFGSTIQAQTVVLAVFMGGLALGNRIFGRRADLLRQPLVAYAYIEMAIALFAFFFGDLYALADKVFIAVGSKILEQSGWLLLLKGALSVALLLGPTVLMGGTLPLLAAWLAKESDDAGRRSARFYSTNSLGAVFGSFLAGFFLIRELGMVSGLQITAIANFFVGLTALGLARREMNLATTSTPSASTAAAPMDPSVRKKLLWASMIVSITGGVSMGLEVLASRCLSLIFGASLQAFAIVLMAFILGIGLGSAVIASRRLSRENKERTIVWLLLSAALCIGGFVFTIEQWTFLYAKLRSGLNASSMGFQFHQILVGLISICVLGLPAALLGSVLPLCIRMVSESATALGDQVGRLLTWNTLGAVVGVLFTGFILMPGIGLRGALATLAIALSVIALVLAWTKKLPRSVLGAGVIGCFLIFVALVGGENWRHVLGSGIFRLRAKEISWYKIKELRTAAKIHFYEDAADATVSVETSPLMPDEIGLRINGKPDASNHGDLSTQYLLGHLPMLARPQSKEIFVLGFGSGITAGAVLGHPINHLTIAENCQPILRAAKWFEPWNRGVLTNARTHVVYEDARTVLKLNPQKYDIIISEPSNPWVAGIGNVFSKEFYELASSRLKDDGIMAQWFHLYEMHDGIVFLVFRTFGKVFPYIEIWDVGPGDVVLLGSNKPWHSTPETFRQVFAREQPRKDLESIGLTTPESVFIRQLASQRTAFAIAGEGPIQSDVFPVLEYSAPMAFYIGQMAKELFTYDERTVCMELMPAERKAILNALPDKLLSSVFNEFSSSNVDLARYLDWLKDHPREASYPVNPLLPVILRAPESYPRKAETAEKSSAELIQMRKAQVLIWSQPDRWREGVEIMDNVVAGYLRHKPKSTDWKVGAFAALAARTRLGNGDLAGAQNSIAMGLQADPQEPQLLFLQRILERELWQARKQN